MKTRTYTITILDPSPTVEIAATALIVEVCDVIGDHVSIMLVSTEGEISTEDLQSAKPN